ncbi:MAG TPA: YbaB/EbfC family nucleoid-associated protein [Alphaproteobacteria bacterium]|jgi:DNA-binding YbaB/EbfC family protein|nr:YbaB/EbfC family nucleoid-associated protein [Alphaproteobacteria bacterium]
MKNLGQMMKQAQEMQSRMAEMQKRLEAEEITGQSGGGMVQVTLTGKGDARRVALDPKIVDAQEKEVLEDLIVAAINDGRAKVEARLAEEMAKLTGGLNLPPGLKLPF